jgi:hypothetical protein
LRAAQAEGKPLLVIVVAGEEAGDIYEHPMWKAATDPKSVAMLRQGKVVAWGAWAGSEEMQQGEWSNCPPVLCHRRIKLTPFSLTSSFTLYVAECH